MSRSELNRIIQGDALESLKLLSAESIDCCVTSPPYYGSKRLLNMAAILQNMSRNEKGQFERGTRNAIKTEFKKGQHWREPKPYWKKEWLYNEYVVKERSLGEIAADFNVTEPAIRFWARKHGIPTRTTSEARSIKYWGLPGEKNGMHGRYGDKSPNWKGGVSPERQALYSSEEWSKAVSFVWKRDAAMCQRCGVHRSSGEEFHIHHKVSFSVKEKRAKHENLVLLCKECHNFVHSKKNVNKEFLDDPT